MKEGNDKANNDDSHEYVNSSFIENVFKNANIELRGQMEIAAEGMRDDLSFSLSDNETPYIRELKLRIRHHLVYSFLFLVFFVSPLALLALFYGYKASLLINENDFAAVEDFLVRAHFINIMVFIMGALIYATYFIVSLVLLSNSNFS